MKSDNLPGLTPVWLLCLSTALAILVCAGVPAVVAPEPIRVQDWLGFFGGLIGSSVTLAAAIVAWKAVQQQIETQRDIAERQSALQAYEILHRLAATLENELRLAMSLGGIAENATLIDEFRTRELLQVSAALLLFPQYEAMKKRLKDIRAEWEIAETKRWQFKSALAERMEFEGTLVELARAFEIGVANLVTIKDVSPGDVEKVAMRQASLDKMSFVGVVRKVRAARVKYTTAINVELAQLLPRLEKAKSDAGL
jgi:hypothetical protein